MNRYVSIWIGCFAIAVMLLTSVSVPIQFSEARQGPTQQLFNNCNDETNCAIAFTGAEGEGDQGPPGPAGPMAPPGPQGRQGL